jgi:fimbrial isopeptide formation D2 family protein
VNGGDQVTFQIVVQGAPPNATGFEMVDTLPTELTFVSAGPGGVTTIVNGQQVRIGNVSSDANGRIVVTLTAQVASGATCGTVALNTAQKEFAGTGSASVKIVGNCTTP